MSFAVGINLEEHGTREIWMHQWQWQMGKRGWGDGEWVWTEIVTSMSQMQIGIEGSSSRQDFSWSSQ